MDLSIIIPAYNEEKRLPPTLDRIVLQMTRSNARSYEIIVVDDGSSDRTSKSVEAFIARYNYIRLIRLPQNKGRGVAVAQGVGVAHGDLILEMDADGSVDTEAIPRFADFMKTHPDVDMLIGSRNIEGSKILRRQPLLRIVLGLIFFMLAWIMFGWDFRDRVNGFKMFRKQAAIDIFAHQHETGFLAEAEIVVIATRRNWSYELLPVAWTDYRDSRIKPFKESWRSLWGMFDIVKRLGHGKYDKKMS